VPTQSPYASSFPPYSPPTFQSGSYGPTAGALTYPAVPPKNKSHVVRNIVLIVLAFVLLAMVGCAALAFKGLTMLRDSQPTRLAVRTAEHSPFVQQRIGVPLRTSMWVSGDFHSSLDGGVKTGSANLKISVTGPKGEGTLFAKEEQGPQGWRIVSLTYADANSGSTPLVKNGVAADPAEPQGKTF
jgi:hypothetical protein